MFALYTSTRMVNTYDLSTGAWKTSSITLPKPMSEMASEP